MFFRLQKSYIITVIILFLVILTVSKTYKTNKRKTENSTYNTTKHNKTEIDKVSTYDFHNCYKFYVYFIMIFLIVVALLSLGYVCIYVCTHEYKNNKIQRYKDKSKNKQSPVTSLKVQNCWNKLQKEYGICDDWEII